MKTVIYTALGGLALTGALAANAGERYHGLLDDHGRPVTVTLSVPRTGAPEEQLGALRFGEPWACGFDLEPLATGARQSTYFLRGSAPGRCAALAAGYLQSNGSGAGLQVELFDRSNRAPALYTLRLKAVAP